MGEHGEADEEESLKRSIDSNNNPIYAMVLDDPNPEEVGNEYGIEVYDKVWGACALRSPLSYPRGSDWELF